jgi:hypothetical protein
MNRQHSYLLVEGRQDVFFVGRILEELGLRSADRPALIPAKWEPFLDNVEHQRDQPERRAGRGGVPFWRMFKPACLFSDTHVVIVEPVDGNRAKFGRTLRATNALLDGGLASLTGVGIVPDADIDPMASFASARVALQSTGLAVPSNNQEVVAGSPNTGVFVLPGGMAPGGLEQVQIDCADAVYPALIAGARTFVNSVDTESATFTDEDMREMKTPQGPVKAIVGAVSSVLKPGSTIQVSVLRDRWVTAPTLGVPRVAAIVRFLKSLCGLP